ncbi:MAG: hypothetical protein V3U65_10700 [Granulosicoccaceae bacterium]
MHSVTHFTDRRAIIALASTLLVSVPASADDLDVYSSQLAGQIKPNILLVLDYSGSMTQDVGGFNTSVVADQKITILKEAVNALMIEHEDRVNLGLGSLYGSTPSGVRWPVADLTDDPHTIDNDITPDTYSMRDVINAQLEQRSAYGATNTVGALADAALYFQAGPVTHNDASLSSSWSHHPDHWSNADSKYSGGNPYSALPASYFPEDAFQAGVSSGSLTDWCRDYTSYNPAGQNYCAGKTILQCVDRPPSSGFWDHDDNDSTPTVAYNSPGYNSCEYESNTAWTQPNYVSPIAHECQKNYMILISDGIPTVRTTGATLDSVLGASYSSCEDVSTSIFGDSGETYGNCGAEILHKMATEDQIAAIPDSKVKSYTIGFSVGGSGKAYLEKLAAAGQGQYFPADDKKQLTEALELLLDDILKGSESFAELSIDLNKASFSHDNRAYFSLFDPSSKPAWNGNVKGYYVTQTGLVDVNNAPAIITDAEGTRFDSNAQSFWSDAADGNEVDDGGASEQIEQGNRNLYTFTGNTIDTTIGEDLTATVNMLDKSNTMITDGMLNNPSDKAALLDWLQTAPMGDPLHSKVVTANYSDKKVVFAITNQGFLHAIDASKPTDINTPDSSGGEELFAFMPQELLGNLSDIKANASGPGGHIYGLDGQITPVHTDTNDNGIVDSGESLMLVFGMRRGGNNYYAVDVTNYNSPRLMWRIQGGAAPFAHLAQTWSRMSLVSVKAESSPNAVITAKKGAPSKQVLVFSGGYDAAVVDGTDGNVAASGNAIYMIDLDGTPIWSTSGLDNAEMDYSIPSDLVVVDTDGDRLADRIYVGDTGSQVWRVDFNNVDGGNAEFDVSLFAQLNDTANQPFFYPPSIALNHSSKGDHLSVSLTSGNRTDPLNADSLNAIYMLRDNDTEKGPPSGSINVINEGDLFKATDNSIASTDAGVASTAHDDLAASKGWFIELNLGEKGLSAPLTFEGNLMATTYEPSTTMGDGVCDFVATGKLYIMDLKDGRPVKYTDDGSRVTEGLLAADRISPLSGSRIPSSPIILFPEGSSQVNIIVDKESISMVAQRLQTVFWHGQ